jgi:hypothetical protein
MTAADLRALAKRVCEEQPSRELDGAIGAAFRPGWEAHPLAPGAIRETWVGINAARKATGCPRYTTSLDAAASLMPEGWHWEVRDDGVARSTRPENNPSRCIAQHPAAALCAAALLAMAADMEAQSVENAAKEGT